MGRNRRREAMLQAAIGLFSDKGYHATTVREIAQAVGILPGSLYAHMASKEDLLYEAVVQASERFREAVAPIAESPGHAGERLRQAMAAHIRVVAESPAAATVFLHEWRALSPQRRAMAVAHRRAYEELLARIIREGVESGVFRPVDEKFVRLLVLSAVNWTYQWYRADGPLSPEQVADQFYAIIAGGLLRNAADPGSAALPASADGEPAPQGPSRVAAGGESG
ncbi:TetR/AcrR family transcriptional regulator [Symbiobacterium thermophilum]|uniref:TetR/AcrR family transcriptional regulator n=1 Tax=Symbiobacterium thermophilum TaxID=2734 RepID=A0A953IBC2_SYMTR|nr:TetR/AcrR family transcriptional regulator [Symbiobacterium thermophilum]MBY6277091.1 TetR/AcrR family transcriptional regulator [Symbiobacterium thermophilum]